VKENSVDIGDEIENRVVKLVGPALPLMVLVDGGKWAELEVGTEAGTEIGTEVSGTRKQVLVDEPLCISDRGSGSATGSGVGAGYWVE
jgi:hypothetical protein